jgi:PAS domain S-box-containing protein
MDPQDLGIGKLFERIQDAVIVAAAKTQRIVLWNPAATNIFGYSASEVLELRVEDLVPEYLKDQHRKGMAHYAETGHGPYIDSLGLLELPALRKGGKEIYVELSLSSIEPEGGIDSNERFVLAIIHDITERKQAEKELQESQRRFKQLFDQSVDALLVHDNNGRIVDCNKEACRSLGYSHEEMLSLYVKDIDTNLISNEDRQRTAEPTLWQRAMAGEPGTLAGVHYGGHRRKDGTTFPVEVHVGSVNYGGRQMILASIRDITERKRMEEEVSQLNKDLENQVAERTEQLKIAMAKQQQEARERQRIEQELQVARLIQQTLLPKSAPELERYQIAAYYQPAREVGGDFYDFFELEDGRLGLVVGDASGKGIPAAMVMANTRSVLRTVTQRGGVAPGEVLAEANEILYPDIPPNMFITCFYAILDPKSGSLSYANAGHDLPYRWHGGDAEELRARGMPLGLMPGMTYEQKETLLQAGEVALIYSDGLVEAHDPKGEMFGFPRLRELIADHGEEKSLVDSLLEELHSFTGEGWDQEDDITLLTLRCSVPLS